jgi:hypothetical protein
MVSFDSLSSASAAEQGIWEYVSISAIPTTQLDKVSKDAQLQRIGEDQRASHLCRPSKPS